MSLLNNLTSISFIGGFVIGFLANRLYCLLHAMWLDRHEPLPDGKHRSKWQAVSIHPRWFAALVAVALVSWSVYTTSANAEDNRQNAANAAAFAERVQDCQSRLIQAIIDGRKVTDANTQLTTENDRLSREERALLADGLQLQSEWIGKLLDPQDPNVKGRSTNDPIRQQYNIDVTRGFFNRARDITKRIGAIHAEQDANDQSRTGQRPPLPDPECGS